jgi:hypothetical protein
MTERHDVFGIRTEQLFDQREVVDRLGELLRHHNAAVIGRPAMLGEEHFDHGEIFGELHQAVGVDIAALLERQSRKMQETIVGQGVLNLLVINAGGAEKLLGQIGAASTRNADEKKRNRENARSASSRP